MLGTPNQPVVQQEEIQQEEPQQDLLGQIGGLIGGAAEGAAQFIQDNPELAGLIGGALAGGQVGFGGIGAAGGLISGSQKRKQQQSAQETMQLKLEKIDLDRKDRRENALRANLKTEIQDFKDRGVSIKGIEDALSRGTGAGDVAAVTSFQKLIDPSGRVSDADFQNAMKTAGLINESATKIKGIWTGVKLDGKARQQMLFASVGQFQAAEKVFDDTVRSTVEQANRQGLTVQNIIDKPRIQFNVEETISNNREAFSATLGVKKNKKRKSRPGTFKGFKIPN